MQSFPETPEFMNVTFKLKMSDAEMEGAKRAMRHGGSPSAPADIPPVTAPSSEPTASEILDRINSGFLDLSNQFRSLELSNRYSEEYDPFSAVRPGTFSDAFPAAAGGPLLWPGPHGPEEQMNGFAGLEAWIPHREFWASGLVNRVPDDHDSLTCARVRRAHQGRF